MVKIEIVPLAEVITKMNGDAARNRGSGETKEPLDISTSNPDIAVSRGKTLPRAQMHRGRAGKEVHRAQLRTKTNSRCR